MAQQADHRAAATISDGRWWVHRAGLIAGLAVLGIAAAAWVSVVRQAVAGSMSGPAPVADGMGGMELMLDASEAAMFVGSWGAMMAAMMLPSAIPMMATYSTVRVHVAAKPGHDAAATALFVLPYPVLWLLTGVPVYLGSTLVAAASMNDGLARLAPYAVAVVLVGAGAYQLSGFKRACLRLCRLPLALLVARWHPGVAGAMRIGVAHAGYCLSCCWMLMVVLVAAGAMGLPWVVLIAVLVLAEKVLPDGVGTTRAAALVLILLGLAVAVRPELAGVLSG